jgi:hypothetical protein
MSDYKVQASLFSREYNIGYNPAFSIRATKLSSGNYLIESKNGDGPAEISVGDKFLGKDTISVNENGDLEFDKFTIPVGHNLLYGVTAEPKDAEGNTFALFTKGNEKSYYKTVKLGEIDGKTGLPWSVDQYGNLVNAGKSVKVLPQLNTRNLLVRGKVDGQKEVELGVKDAYYATFEYVDSTSTATHSSKGYYVRNPMRGVSGEFKEEINGELITTARVRFSNKMFTISMRTPEQAYEAHTLYEEKRDIERQLASFRDPVFVRKTLIGIEAEAIEEIKAGLKETLDDIGNKIELSKQCWMKSQPFFSHNEGRDLLLGNDSKPRQYTSSEFTP